MTDWIEPDWPAPAQVRTVITTRRCGVSASPFDAFNLADHVGDDPESVRRNREQLRKVLGFSSEPRWLEQVHGCDVAEEDSWESACQADAATATRPGTVCAVLTADCLPLLICNRSGSRVAAVHAGWRGLAAGVIEATLGRFEDAPSELLVWLGPAIGPAAFEVGPEVREAFLAVHPTDEICFVSNRPGHWLADIYQLARNRLQRAGIGYVGGGDYCTVSEPERFFSYRRDGITGRMASLIWLEN